MLVGPLLREVLRLVGRSGAGGAGLLAGIGSRFAPPVEAVRFVRWGGLWWDASSFVQECLLVRVHFQVPCFVVGFVSGWCMT